MAAGRRFPVPFRAMPRREWASANCSRMASFFGKRRPRVSKAATDRRDHCSASAELRVSSAMAMATSRVPSREAASGSWGAIWPAGRRPAERAEWPDRLVHFAASHQEHGDAALQVHPWQQDIGIVGVSLVKCREQIHRRPIAGQGAGAVAQARPVGVALHVAEFEIGGGQRLAQGLVFGRILGEFLEVAEGGPDDFAARLGGAGQAFDLGVDVEQRVVGEGHDFGETAGRPVGFGFGAGALGFGGFEGQDRRVALGFGHLAGGLGAPGLDHSYERSRQQAAAGQHGQRETEGVAADELATAVGQRTRVGHHRHAF